MTDKIKKDMIMTEILTNWPEAAGILIEKYDLHCVGCSMAAFETLEQGLAGHGYEDAKIEAIMNELNQLIEGK